MNIRKLCFSILCVMLLQCGCLSASAQERLGVRAEQQTAAEADAAVRAESFRRIFPAVRKGQGALDAARQRTLRFPAQRPQAVAADEAGTLIYGSLLGGNGWGDDTPYGIYSFPASSAAPVEEVVRNNSLNANAGGVLVDDKYCFVNFFDTGMGGIFAYYYVYDTEDWSRVRSNRVQLTSIATDLTYDAVSRKVYGCFLNDNLDGYLFGVFSTEDGSVSPISNLSGPLFAVAANAAGGVYGIDGSGRLLLIDKEDGSQTVIGNTGVKPRYTQSATFDPATGKLYWAACTETLNALYEVDVTTATATLKGEFPGGEEFGGLYIPGQGAEDEAPAAPTDLTVTYDPSTTADLEVAFTMPSTTFSGKALQGELDYVIALNDVEVTMDAALPGAQVRETLRNMTVGEVKVSVYVRNEVGNGPAEKVRLWAGHDAPEAPKNLKAEVDGKSIRLSWQAPEEGLHQGYLDTDALYYKVIRYPGGTVLEDRLTATTYTDTPATLSLSAFWYEVIPYAGNLQGASVTSDKLLIGEAFTVPYSETFDHASDFELFTIIDANHDGVTWKLEDTGSAVCHYSTEHAMDDWLITPPITLSTDYLYRLRFKARSASSGWPEKIRVAMGKDRTVEALDREVLPVTLVNTVDSREYEQLFSLDEAGVWYLGFQSCSDAQMFKLYLDEINLEVAAPMNAPTPVSDLQLTPGSQGERSVHVAFTAPSATMGGAPLQTIDKMTLRRGAVILKTFKNVAAGTVLTYDDATCDLGTNTYTVFSTNEAGNSIETSATVFVGKDIPGLPQHIVLRETADGRAHLTWDAPEKGQNGGYVDADELKYHIVYGNDEQTVIAMNLTDREYTFTPTVSGLQQAQMYIVFAVNDKGIGYGEASNIVVFGTPYDLPFKESFEAADLHYDTWGIIDDDIDASGTWEVKAYGSMPSASPQDRDGGLLTFVPQYKGDEAYLYSGKIDLSKAVNPVVEFYYYYVKGSGNRLSLEVSTDGYRFDEALAVDFAAESGDNGWRKATLSLADKLPTDYVRLGFRAVSDDGLVSTHIDRIVLRDVLDYNLEASGITLPRSMKVGREYEVTVKVTNCGTKAVGTGGFSIDLYRNERKVQTLNGVTILADESRDYVFKQVPDQSFGDRVEYFAVVNFEQDENEANNQTPVVAVEVQQLSLPAPTALTADLDGDNVVFGWQAPDAKDMPAETDDFETYTAFTITDVGEWTLADVDRMGTAYFGYAWPNRGEPQAYIVFNAKAIGADVDEYGYDTDWAPHSGEQCLISFIAEENNTYDWLISPMLDAEAQTVTMWVKGVQGYTDNFEVLVSDASSAVNRESFVKLDGVGGKAPEKWTEISFDLPAGTSFFAVRHTATTADGFALLIDDVTFRPMVHGNLELQGYNLYRDGKAVNAQPLAETRATDVLTDELWHNYHVTACYTFGESGPSNVVNVSATGIANLAADGVEISKEGTRLVVNHAAGKRLTVVNTAGQKVFDGIADEVTVVLLPTDAPCLVTVDGSTHKIL